MTVKNLEHLAPSQRALVCFACLGDVENAFELFKFASLGSEKNLVEATQYLLSLGKSDRKRAISREFEKLSQGTRLQLAADIHPGWLLEVLKKENPRVMQIILNALPTEKSRYIFENLREESKNRLTHNAATLKNLPENLAEIIRKRFETNFPPFWMPEVGSEIVLDHLYFVKTQELMGFIRELGIEQLAKAFKNLPKEALKAFIYRLPVKDAREFQVKMKTLQNVPPRELQEARMLLLQLSLDTIASEELLFHMGFVFLSRSFSKDNPELVRALQFKLEPRYGYFFKRVVEQNIAREKKAEAEWFKKQVLERFKTSAMIANYRGRS